MIDLEGIQANADSSGTCCAKSRALARVIIGEGGGGGRTGGEIKTARCCASARACVRISQIEDEVSIVGCW